MRRLFVLVSLCAGLGALAFALPLVACGGGGDKPPLTPDSIEILPEASEAGAAEPSPAAPPPK